MKFILSDMRATMWRQSSSFPKQLMSYSLEAILQAQILPRQKGRETTGINLQGNLVMSHASQQSWLQQNKGFGSRNSSCSTYLTPTVDKWQCFQDQLWMSCTSIPSPAFQLTCSTSICDPFSSSRWLKGRETGVIRANLGINRKQNNRFCHFASKPRNLATTYV